MKTNDVFLKELNTNLSKQIAHKWRVQSFSKNKPSATIVAYIDARDASDLLNEYATYGWSDEYYEVSGNTYCKVGVVMPDGTTQWRSDCGVESNQDAEKGQASDAFKRACVKWGIGRFLYSLGIEYVNANEAKNANNLPYPIDEQGKRIWDLTEYINNKKNNTYTQFGISSKKPSPAPTPAPAPAPMQPSSSFDDTADRKAKALSALQKAKKVSTVKGLIAEQKAFKSTPEGTSFQSGATLDDVVKNNSIELVGEFYKFVK
jgi:hypothetical protein